MSDQAKFPYPRRKPLRRFMQAISKIAFSVLSNLEIVGKENIPKTGPCIVVANHFDTTDVALMVRVVDPHPMEFLGGFHMVDPNPLITFLPKTYGYYPVHRGAVSTYAMRAASGVLANRGFLCIFPEGGSWAKVLRPARPGTAYLAAKTGASILPIGLTGNWDIFHELKQGKRAKVTARIGKPFGPYQVKGRGRARRDALEEIGHEIMNHISVLLPEERRGVYSDDPAIRKAAEPLAEWPYDDLHLVGAKAARKRNEERL